MRISRGGQISVPADVRHRWGTTRLYLEDLGDSLVLRPAPADAIAEASGALAAELRGERMQDLRERARGDEAAAQARRAP